MREKVIHALGGLITFLVACFCTVLTGLGLLMMFGFGGSGEESIHAQTPDGGIMDKFDMKMTNVRSEALDGIVVIEKVYWLSDDDLVAPVPDPENFGMAGDPAELEWLLEAAKPLLKGEQTLFSTDVKLYDRGYHAPEIHYYLDDTIFAISWQQPVGETVMTICEVKIAHPSQFRRFMTGGEYGSNLRYKTTKMARSVNAVAASNGDYYGHRGYGIVVNNGVTYRAGDEKLDTCFIDKNGDLLFVPMGTLPDKEAADRYVKEHDVRFSLSFGPILIEDGEVRVPEEYAVGAINKDFSRAALCQLGPCHYVLIAANKEPYYQKPPSLLEFAQYLQELGITKAYNLDGGQTATIVMNGKTVNEVDYGGERDISDIIYFATALPAEEE